MAILTDIRDPRVEGVTVTYVEVSPDMRQAKVHVSVMGDDAKQKLCLHGLQSSAGYLQSKLSSRIDTRYTPKLRFELDMGVKNSIAIAKMLSEVLPDHDATDKHADSAEADNDEADNDEAENVDAEASSEKNQETN